MSFSRPHLQERRACLDSGLSLQAAPGPICREPDNRFLTCLFQSAVLLLAVPNLTDSKGLYSEPACEQGQSAAAATAPIMGLCCCRPKKAAWSARSVLSPAALPTPSATAAAQREHERHLLSTAGVAGFAAREAGAAPRAGLKTTFVRALGRPRLLPRLVIVFEGYAEKSYKEVHFALNKLETEVQLGSRPYSS